MAIIKPFKALKPKKELAEQVASRPYDVLNSEEAKKEAAGNNYSFLRITKSEIDLPDGIDTHSQQVYDKARSNLELFIQNGTLFKEEKPCYYIYQLVMPATIALAEVGMVRARQVWSAFLLLRIILMML